MIPSGFYITSRDEIAIVYAGKGVEVWAGGLGKFIFLPFKEFYDSSRRNEILEALRSMKVIEQISDEQITQEKLDMEKFHSPLSMGDKVRITGTKGRGKVGVITAIYDTRYNTANWKDGNQYRVSTGEPNYCGSASGWDTFYCSVKDVIFITTVKAYCYKKGTEFHWFDTEKKRPGFVRESSKDHTFEE